MHQENQAETSKVSSFHTILVNDNTAHLQLVSNLLKTFYTLTYTQRCANHRWSQRKLFDSFNFKFSHDSGGGLAVAFPLFFFFQAIY